MSPRVRGVSLLEMLVVVAILALAGLLAASAFSGGFQGIALRTAAREVAANLRYTRARAISTGIPQRFTIDPAAHTWQAPNDREGEIPERLRVTFTGARELQPRKGEGAIMFFADGAASGGRVQLSVEDAALDIDVAWLTGEVTVKRGQVAR